MILGLLLLDVLLCFLVIRIEKNSHTKQQNYLLLMPITRAPASKAISISRSVYTYIAIVITTLGMTIGVIAIECIKVEAGAGCNLHYLLMTSLYILHPR